LQNVARDGIAYPVPDARRCELTSGDSLYVVVYDNQQHRVESYEHGEANLNLCSLARSDALHSIVAGNWRATAARAEALSDLHDAFKDRTQPETISCKFKM
jgi:hypothetical protein